MERRSKDRNFKPAHLERISGSERQAQTRKRGTRRHLLARIHEEIRAGGPFPFARLAAREASVEKREERAEYIITTRCQT